MNSSKRVTNNRLKTHDYDMAVFKCQNCGAEISREVVELKNNELLDYILPNYRLIDAHDAQDSVPEGFYVYDEDKEMFRLNLEDRKTQPVNNHSIRVGCCGVPWYEENNLECKNGHKVGKEVSDCYTKHSFYIDTENAVKEGEEGKNITDYNLTQLLDILENGSKQNQKRAAFIVVVKERRDELSKGEREKCLEIFKQLIEDKSVEEDVKRVLIKSLAEFDGEEKDILIKELKRSKSEETRKVVVLSFKKPAVEEVIEVLIPAIEKEESKTVRRALVRKISEAADSKGIEELGNSLSKDIDSENKISIADTLGRIKREKSDNILKDNLDRHENEVKASIVRNIDTSSTSRGDSELYSKVVGLLESDSVQVKRAAINSIKDMYSKEISDEKIDESIPVLVEALSDEDDYISGKADRILNEISRNEDFRKKIRDKTPFDLRGFLVAIPFLIFYYLILVYDYIKNRIK